MIVKDIDLFKGIDPGVMDEIVKSCSEESYPKDTVLFNKGDEADSLYILQQGSINLIIENGGTLVYKLTEPGEVFGWASMVEYGTRTASGVCATDLKAVKIEREKLDKIFNLHPDAGLTILRRMANVIAKRLSNAYQDLLSARGQDTTPSYG